MLDYWLLQFSSINPSAIASVYAVLLSFILSNCVAFTYVKTFQGLSYSRAFVQALILGSIVVSIAMQAIGDNIARGIGMFGALTLIRFRSSLKDPRDMIFIFSSLAAGIATGVHAYIVATIGVISFCLAAFSIYRSPWGSNTYFDGILRFNIKNDTNENEAIEKALARLCSRHVLVTLRELGQGERSEYAYQIKLKPKNSSVELIKALNTLETVRGLSILLQESTIEL